MRTISAAILGISLLTVLSVVGCDHLRSRDASASQTEKKVTAPASTMPTGDRYGATAPSQP